MAVDVEDRGLAAERTYLAWQRTALSLAVGVSILVRISPDKISLWSDVLLVFAFLNASWVLIATHGRALRARRAAGRRVGLAGSNAAMLALSTCVLAIASLGLNYG